MDDEAGKGGQRACIKSGSEDGELWGGRAFGKEIANATNLQATRKAGCFPQARGRGFDDHGISSGLLLSHDRSLLLQLMKTLLWVYASAYAVLRFPGDQIYIVCSSRLGVNVFPAKGPSHLANLCDDTESATVRSSRSTLCQARLARFSFIRSTVIRLPTLTQATSLISGTLQLSSIPSHVSTDSPAPFMYWEDTSQYRGKTYISLLCPIHVALIALTPQSRLFHLLNPTITWTSNPYLA